MVIANEVKERIAAIEPDHVFTYKDLGLSPERTESIIKMLNRMAKKGIIVKVSKGRFYKPKQTIFGILPPKQEEIVKDLLEKDNKIIGYITGYAIFNKLGLTTQVPNIIQIGMNIPKVEKKRGIYTIRFIMQPNPISRENIPFLQLLDTIRLIKNVPDTDINQSCRRMLTIIRKYTKQDIEKIIILSRKYNPMPRALLGAMIENIWDEELAKPLRDNLNPITTYNIGIDKQVLPEIQKWNIR